MDVDLTPRYEIWWNSSKPPLFSIRRNAEHPIDWKYSQTIKYRPADIDTTPRCTKGCKIMMWPYQLISPDSAHEDARQAARIHTI